MFWISAEDLTVKSGSNEGLEHLAGWEWLNASDVRCVLSPGSCESDAGLDELFEEGGACAGSEPKEDEEESETKEVADTLFPTTPCQAESWQTHNISHKSLSVCFTVVYLQKTS